MDAKFALQSFNDVDAAINRRIHKMKKGDTLQPFVLTVGPSKTNLKRSYCVVDTTLVPPLCGPHKSSALALSYFRPSPQSQQIHGS